MFQNQLQYEESQEIKLICLEEIYQLAIQENPDVFPELEAIMRSHVCLMPSDWDNYLDITEKDILDYLYKYQLSFVSRGEAVNKPVVEVW
ncbi:hypothetical protein M5X11_07880 [Paenibacillus alginolyticus]|uniref:hypothetical protein n=1 Tax=Paenibacillus alginolyticus TaxID=59839 RepID=UPI0004226B14|nr:hypothetical protein [Paenibacillus alginolyticus]MCY9664875.1 hypothetical protein [Paenibacillus alginolyticus]